MNTRAPVLGLYRSGGLRLARDSSIVLFFLAVFVILSIIAPRFLTATNLSNVLQQVSLVGIIAMPMAMILISGNFDLSIGGQVALIGIVTAATMDAAGTGPGIVIGLAAGLAFGLINGWLVTSLKINSLIATLGTGLVFRGIAYLLAGTAPIAVTSSELQSIANARLLGMPLSALVFAVVAAASAWFLHFSVGGREFFAVGANAEAARYAGARVRLVRYASFAFVGMACSISGVFLLGFLNSADPTVAGSWPLDVIAAVVLGGVSVAGGKGSIGGSVAGVLLIGVINNGFNLLNLDPNLYQVVTGLIIITAVGFDGYVQQHVQGSGGGRVSKGVLSQVERLGSPDAPLAQAPPSPEGTE
jgi:ribose transport system permease protein